MLSKEQHAWTKNFVKMDFEAPHGARSGPKEVMGDECDITHGVILDPADFVVCATHGHVIDTSTPECVIVAKSLEEWKKTREKHQTGQAGHAHGNTHAHADTHKPPKETMGPDCDITHGVILDPADFVVCATHGHVIDTSTPECVIVAKSLEEWKAKGHKGKSHQAVFPDLGPMLPDCKIVHGKVHGPKHHVLCHTHGHVLDDDKKIIIALSIDDYNKVH